MYNFLSVGYFMPVKYRKMRKYRSIAEMKAKLVLFLTVVTMMIMIVMIIPFNISILEDATEENNEGHEIMARNKRSPVSAKL